MSPRNSSSVYASDEPLPSDEEAKRISNAIDESLRVRLLIPYYPLLSMTNITIARAGIAQEKANARS